MRIVLFSAMIAVLFFFSSCRKEKPRGSGMIPSVGVVTVEQGTDTRELEIIAEIKPLQYAALIPRVNGTLLKKCFEEGGYVLKDSLLYEIEPDQYQINLSRAKADLDMAKARAINANSNYKRTDQLFREEVATPQKYDSALSEQLAANAAVLSADASVRQAELNLSYTKIKAPFNGWIGISAYDVGAYIPVSSKPLNTISYIDEVRVEFELSDASMTPAIRAQLQSGISPDMAVSLIENDVRLYPLPGKLRFWNNQISTRTNTLRIQAVFANPDRTLMPGMFVRVKLRSPNSTPVIRFNKRALKQDLTSCYVFVINAAGVIELRRIEIGSENGDMVIAKSGLHPGERLAVTASPFVRSGVKVKVLK